MNPNLNKQFQAFVYFIMALILSGCGSTAAILSTPIENIDLIPLKIEALTEAEKKE